MLRFFGNNRNRVSYETVPYPSLIASHSNSRSVCNLLKFVAAHFVPYWQFDDNEKWSGLSSIGSAVSWSLTKLVVVFILDQNCQDYWQFWSTVRGKTEVLSAIKWSSKVVRKVVRKAKCKQNKMCLIWFIFRTVIELVNTPFCGI